MAFQLLMVVVIAVLLTSLALVTIDFTPGFSPVSVEGYDGSVKRDALVVPLDYLMKGPVTLQQDDPKLIQRIISQYLHHPSDAPYQLHSINDDPSMGQSKMILNILGEQVNNGGFFVECGALDGETRSNTLVFEKKYGWRGVLIEGDPKNFELVKQKNRKTWTVNACLSTQPYPNTVMFKQQFNIGKISKLVTGEKHKGYSEVQCLPFYSVLLALNITTVDYFSLDVEGSELEVLRTIPWDKVNIKIMSVEFIHGAEGKEALKKYVMDQGYKVYSEVTHKGGYANDYIFYKNDIVPWIQSGSLV
ncbi:hypothetical protein Pcinc_024301 [Petrolisthes cinctipes]|uniref:Methyltransferase FkbM domain-containing protein n=1 Tax=Petrolisthes cinctipes TaxID=88211 RepID=A0AAE1KFI4_PETCI|nr:hypothetical protein Pcinc_024301 [Petrolisthes cinctipes]